MRRTFLFVSLVLASAVFAQTPPAPVVSPEVHADNRVTFRFRAPNAKEVALALEGAAKDLPMQKDEQGVWSVTTEPLAPDFYGYAFVADGVHLIDPPLLDEPNLLNTTSQVHVPGPASLPWEVSDVPHGEVHHHFYKSAVVGDQRDFYVYTPPGMTLAGSRAIQCCTCCTDSAMTRAAGPRWTRPRNHGQPDRTGKDQADVVVMPLDMALRKFCAAGSARFAIRAARPPTCKIQRGVAGRGAPARRVGLSCEQGQELARDCRAFHGRKRVAADGLEQRGQIRVDRRVQLGWLAGRTRQRFSEVECEGERRIEAPMDCCVWMTA